MKTLPDRGYRRELEALYQARVLDTDLVHVLVELRRGPLSKTRFACLGNMSPGRANRALAELSKARFIALRLKPQGAVQRVTVTLTPRGHRFSTAALASVKGR